MTYGLLRRIPAWTDDGIGILEFVETMEDSACPTLFATNVSGFLAELWRLPEMEHLTRMPLVASYWRRLAQKCEEMRALNLRAARKPPPEFYSSLMVVFERIRLRTWFLYVDTELAPTPQYHQLRA
ncbi:unnamed protein product [Symbiodinium sp. CCMP2592]|nr:unnamed protein product [Symbiodinium sp. CCMP2592]